MLQWVTFHLEQETWENIRAGMSPRDARRKAYIDFGGVERFKEQSRDVGGYRPLADAAQDVRPGGDRCLKPSPGDNR